VAKEVATAKLLEVSGNLKERYLAQANIAPINFLVNALRLSNECDINYRMSKNKRLTVEIALTKMCYIKNALTVSSSPNSAGEAKKK
jgi:DNA polymerase-3 subunit gamma/tau